VVPIFFFFEKFLKLQAGKPKYWRPRKISSILGSWKFCKSCRIGMVRVIDKKKKTGNPNQLKSHQKNFQPDRTQNGWEKGGETFFCYSKTDFEKNSKKFFFSTFFIMNYFRFFCIADWMGIFLPWKKIFFFGGVPPSKISFFTHYTTWQTSNFYSTDRVDPDAPLEIKIRKTKKKNFLFRKGGGSP